MNGDSAPPSPFTVQSKRINREGGIFYLLHDKQGESRIFSEINKQPILAE